MKRTDIRNIAIIAHVDHGKTTLVDGMLRQSGTFRDNQQVAERVMDSNPLERERGITILAKNTSITFKGVKINIVDTPGHADFGGEVERILSMVDSALLLVDAAEGPMPQTRFVLAKALAMRLRPIVVINKIDKPAARPDEVLNEVFDLFCHLGADDDQLDFPVIYASAKQGFAINHIGDEQKDLQPLFDLIIEKAPCPDVDADKSLQLLVNALDYDRFLGRLILGKISRGTLKTGDTVSLVKRDGSIVKSRINKIFTFDGLKRADCTEAQAGEIITIAGIEEVEIGETIADAVNPEALPLITVDEPTLSITFSVNNSPLAGTEGEFVTANKMRDRIYHEAKINVSLRVEETDSPETLKVSGRGELHLSILIETMRREGYEFQVSRPQVIYKTIDGVLHEPMEHLTLDLPEDAQGGVIELLGRKKAVMSGMVADGSGRVKLEFIVPARGLIGFRNVFLTETRGEGIMHHNFHAYEPYRGDIPHRIQGSLVAMEDGVTVGFALFSLQDRGVLFVDPAVKVYTGMIIGEHSRENDLDVNASKTKKLTNMRASGTDEAIRLTPPIKMSLEQAIGWINDTELVELTPKSIRLRKRYLDANERKKMEKMAAKA